MVTRTSIEAYEFAQSTVKYFKSSRKLKEESIPALSNNVRSMEDVSFQYLRKEI